MQRVRFSMANVNKLFVVISDITKWIEILLKKVTNRKHIRMFIKVNNDFTKHGWFCVRNFKLTDLRFHFA